MAGFGGVVAGDVDAAVESFVIGLDPCGFIFFLIDADDAARAAGDDFDDASAHFLVFGDGAALAVVLAWGFGCDADAIAVEGGFCFVAGDEDAGVDGEVDA